MHVARRGSPAQAATLMRHVIGRDDTGRTAHQTAADTPAEQLPDVVAHLVAEHHQAVTHRRNSYQKTQRRQRDRTIDHHLGLDHTRTRGQERDQGYDLSL